MDDLVKILNLMLSLYHILNLMVYWETKSQIVLKKLLRWGCTWDTESSKSFIAMNLSNFEMNLGDSCNPGHLEEKNSLFSFLDWFPMKDLDILATQGMLMVSWSYWPIRRNQMKAFKSALSRAGGQASNLGNTKCIREVSSPTKKNQMQNTKNTKKYKRQYSVRPRLSKQFGK